MNSSVNPDQTSEEKSEENPKESNENVEQEAGLEREESANGQAGADKRLSEVDALKNELKEQQNKYLYLYAEFENYKKRAIKERSDFLKFGHEGLIRDLLQVADNFERGLEHRDNLEALAKGLELINQQLKDVLTRFGVSPIKAVGEKFDPTLHEAVEQTTKDEAQAHVEQGGNGKQVEIKPGFVFKEHQKGYLLHGRLLRPSRVTVVI